MKRIKLAYYRYRLKHAYLKYRQIVDDFSCGAALTEHISSSAATAKNAVNGWINKINTLQPGTLTCLP